MRHKLRYWVVVSFRGALALAAALLILLGVLLQIGVYHKPIWFPIAVAAIVALGSLISNSKGTIAAAMATRRETARARILKASIAAVFHVSRETNIEPLVIGVSVFRARRRLEFQRAAWPVHTVNRLYRVSRFRLNDIPQPSAVRWLEGKGTIGACLRAGRWQHQNRSPIAQRYEGPDVISRQDYDQLPDDERSGFTYKEFVGIIHKYAEILAVPIKSEGGARVVGVLAVDRPYDAALTATVFDATKIRAAAEIAAAAIHQDVQDAPILDP